MKLFTNAYHRLRKWNSMRRDIREAKHRLLSSTDLTDEEKNILNRVSLKVDDADTMFQGNAFHYLSVGLSASRCIQKALLSTQVDRAVGTILDFPCGHGRVLRFLRAMFPHSNICAGEIDNSTGFLVAVLIA